ncbi:hypothetical protein [Ruania albidiflava]|uniref:hypothetical protein n=1 Tax=Ruania albidiflava TaxID=366586 RepID=UPI0023F2C0F9|nr:hypothetical protein [Ruania albidiflava]
MPPLIFGLIGAGLTALAVWFRVGTSRAARWWVRPVPVPFRGHDPWWAKEHIALVAVPYVAQLFLLLAIGMLPQFHEMVPVFLLLIEILVGGIGGGLLRYRYILPLWLYPAWLRPVRAKERDELRRLRA